MKQASKNEKRRSRLGLSWSMLGAGFGLALACAGKTQSLNQVDERLGPDGDSSAASTASGGSGGESSNTAAVGGNAATSDGVTVTVSSSAASTASGATSSTTGSLPRSVFANKLDVLFVVDNSIGMADKQEYLVAAANNLLASLLDPDASGFGPLTDVHLGVISSSIGGQGGEICSALEPQGTYNATKNDAAHLIPTRRSGLTSNSEAGFLIWDPIGQYEDGESDVGSLQAALSEHIRSVGEVGCGYEAPLEAMYRFLVEPTPPLTFYNDGEKSLPETDDNGQLVLDEELLTQRAEFLRPDSALAIVILSDEDDCSINGTGLGFLTSTATLPGNGGVFNLPAATSACESDPNDVCCRSCGVAEAAPPPGCVPPAEDPACISFRDRATDPLNLRCFDQKRRFGMDMLYPVSRYVAGLTQLTVVDTHLCADDDCPVVENPLFPPEDPAGRFTRTPRDVFVLGLVGVPWQDLATETSLNETGLTYKSEAGNLTQSDWNLIVGDPSQYIPPGDPFMVASIEPRLGTNPITGEATGDPASTDPRENSINGHEHQNPSLNMLQYACTFPLQEPRDCSPTNTYTACECTETDLSKNSSLCQPPGGGEAGMIQYYVGATPGLRHLELLSELPGGVPASICPKVTAGDPTDASYGYGPAVRALVQRLAPVFGE